MKKNIKRPNKVKVGQNRYKVVSRSKSWQKKHDAVGRIDYEAKIIELGKHQKSKDMADTFLHEIVHGIIKEYKIKMDGRKEEAFVKRFANGLTDIFEQNPNIMPWLIKKLVKKKA